jgi:tetratricopeptide (TPR) repeat protein
MDITHYYELLGLKIGASEEEIKGAYRDLAKVWHPDRFAHDPLLQRKAEEKLKEINEAYQKIQHYLNNPYEYHQSFESGSGEFSQSEKSFKSDAEQSTESEDRGYDYSQPPPEPPKEPSFAEELINKKPRPWVRFFARTFDLLLLSFPTAFLFGIIFPNFTARLLTGGIVSELIFEIIVFPFIFVMEALVISIFGNTPAKAILKTKILNSEGKELSFQEALKRGFYIYVAAFCFGLPIINLIAYLVQYNKLKKDGKTPWDKRFNFNVYHSHIGMARGLLYVALCFLLVMFIKVIRDTPAPIQPKQQPQPLVIDPLRGDEPIFAPAPEKAPAPAPQKSLDELWEEMHPAPEKAPAEAPAPALPIQPEQQQISQFRYTQDKYIDSKQPDYEKTSDYQKKETIYKKEQYEKTIDDYSKEITINPNDKILYAGRGNAYCKKGQYEKAIEDYTKTIEIDPSYRVAYFNRGIAYFQKGQYDRALEDFQKACDLGDENGCKEMKIILEKHG